MEYVQCHTQGILGCSYCEVEEDIDYNPYYLGMVFLVDCQITWFWLTFGDSACLLPTHRQIVLQE